MRLSSVILVALLLTGCTTTTYYDLPSGKTNEDFQRALAKCRAQSAMIPPDPSMNGFFQIAMLQAYINNCLRADGYVARRS
jgi:PBP1b-binding outer membrane lipoprotein LpoB